MNLWTSHKQEDTEAGAKPSEGRQVRGVCLSSAIPKLSNRRSLHAMELLAIGADNKGQR